MNVLEQLASDMADVGREARISGEDETDACLAVVHEFSAGHEVVEVVRADSEKHRDHWLLLPGDCQYKHLENYSDYVTQRLTIIVPRKQEPTLLEATERASAAWHQSVVTTPAMTDAMLELDAAIKRARDRDE